MRRSQVLQRMRRGQSLQPAAAGRPDPAAVGADCLAPVRVAGLLAGVVLGLLAVAAPWLTGDLRAALLPGVPAALLFAAHVLGRGLTARRIAAIASTSVAGFVVLSTLPSLAALDQLEGPHARAMGLQLACLIVGGAVLLRAWPAWRAFHELSVPAEATRQAFDEL